jgi:transposase
MHERRWRWYLERTGCQWRQIPREYGAWQTIRYFFDRWTEDGTLDRTYTVLRERLRKQIGRERQPSAGDHRLPERQDDRGRRRARLR